MGSCPRLSAQASGVAHYAPVPCCINSSTIAYGPSEPQQRGSRFDWQVSGHQVMPTRDHVGAHERWRGAPRERLPCRLAWIASLWCLAALMLIAIAPEWVISRSYRCPRLILAEASPKPTQCGKSTVARARTHRPSLFRLTRYTAPLAPNPITDRPSGSRTRTKRDNDGLTKSYTNSPLRE